MLKIFGSGNRRQCRHVFDALRARVFPSLRSPIFLGSLKVHKHEIFLKVFFAETETLWSQGPVTRDF
jgi:hypothetical protein